MKTYQHFASILTQLLGSDTALRLTVNGYMPLSVEHIGQSAEGNRLIAISHTGEQNGDLMRDPERVFEIHTYITPHMADYDDSGKNTHIDARLKQDLKSYRGGLLKSLMTGRNHLCLCGV